MGGRGDDKEEETGEREGRGIEWVEGRQDGWRGGETGWVEGRGDRMGGGWVVYRRESEYNPPDIGQSNPQSRMSPERIPPAPFSPPTIPPPSVLSVSPSLSLPRLRRCL